MGGYGGYDDDDDPSECSQLPGVGGACVRRAENAPVNHDACLSNFGKEGGSAQTRIPPLPSSHGTVLCCPQSRAAEGAQ